jgi:hypothetical protein
MRQRYQRVCYRLGWSSASGAVAEWSVYTLIEKRILRPQRDAETCDRTYYDPLAIRELLGKPDATSVNIFTDGAASEYPYRFSVIPAGGLHHAQARYTWDVKALQSLAAELATSVSGGAKVSCSRKDAISSLSVEDRALAILVKHPEWTNVEIAEAIGAHPKYLSSKKCARFKAARKTIRVVDVPKGSKSIDGGMEAIVDADIDFDDIDG